MAEFEDACNALAEIISDYREGDAIPRGPQHVAQWISQFDEPDRLGILRELSHVLGSTYISRAKIVGFLNGLFATKDLVGDDPCAFWRSANFLDIQGGGHSQKEMLALFDVLLKRQCGFGIAETGQGNALYVYLDDAMFTGNRVKQDIINWLPNAPEKAELHVIVAATHEGTWWARSKVSEAITASKKDLKVRWWRSINLEDRKYRINVSDVLRPIAIPDIADVQAYANQLAYAPTLRAAGSTGLLGLFSSDASRQLLERTFLIGGVQVRSVCPHLNEYQRPLGNMVLAYLGFGSLISTFRNCPNNAPLVLWAGDPWYPLLPRTTNSQTAMRHWLEALAQEDA